MMGGFLSAIQFLTIVPVKSKNADEKNLGLSLLYFPAVGLILGLVLICIYHLLVFLGFQPWAAAVILTVSLTLITGGLHLDGLADTLDALAGGRDREQMLQIMRDPHIGTMGVLGLLCAVLLKTVLVASLSAPALLKALPVMCVLSRWAMVFLLFVFPYAREEGKAGVFFRQRNRGVFISSTIIALVCVIALMGLKGVFIFPLVAISAYEMGEFMKRRLNGITGDVIGGISEVSEIIILVLLFTVQ